MSEPTATTPQKLPVFRSVTRTYALTFANIPTLARFIWAWLVVLTAVLTLLALYLWPAHQAAALDGTFSMPLAEVLGPWLLSVAIGSSIAVGWHRFILLGESPQNSAYARCDGVVVRYVLTSICLMAPPLLVFVIPTSSLVSDLAPVSLLALALTACLLVVLWFIAIVRLSLLLPAISLQRDDIGVARSLKATSGNFWRMSMCGLLVAIPSIVILTVLAAVSADPGQETVVDFVRNTVLTEVVGITFGMLAVTLLSLQFRHFFAEAATVA